MEKLKNKVFYVLVFILTLCILSFIIVYNTSKYIEAKNSIENSLRVVSERHEDRENDIPPMKKDDRISDNSNIKFLDNVIYTILVDENKNIKEIINHSSNELENSKISKIAKAILNKDNLEKEHIGFLYFDKYSYTYSKNNSLTILDNSEVKSNLIASLELSLLVFVLLELLIIFITKKITNWIIKPVRLSFEKQKEFIADASHELKTPLAVIVASIDALEENPKEKKWIKNIKNETSRMNKLVTSLLDLAKSEHIETYKMDLKNLSKLTELSLLSFESIAYENNIKLEYEIENDIKFNMDDTKIRELIEILLDNAFKHTENKGLVKIILKSDKNSVSLIVQNEGEEIKLGDEEKIFERFYRIDKSRNRNQNRYGLGLAIAKNIVENHGGTICAYSENGITTFKVLFKK